MSFTVTQILVGEDVGLNVGSMVGDRVVGESVGCNVGCSVGSAEGVPVGWVVGAKLPISGPLVRRLPRERWPLDEGGGDVLREASGTGDGEELAGCARGEFRWEPVDDVVRGSGQEHGGRL